MRAVVHFEDGTYNTLEVEFVELKLNVTKKRFFFAECENKLSAGLVASETIKITPTSRARILLDSDSILQ